MACDQDVVRLTYKQLKQMAEGNNREEVADGIYRLYYILATW